MNIRLLSQYPLGFSYALNDVSIAGSFRTMDPAVQRLLNDKLYDKRKQGALESVLARPSLDVTLLTSLQPRKDRSRSKCKQGVRENWQDC